jgi:hypothetical protein
MLSDPQSRSIRLLLRQPLQEVSGVRLTMLATENISPAKGTHIPPRISNEITDKAGGSSQSV